MLFRNFLSISQKNILLSLKFNKNYIFKNDISNYLLSFHSISLLNSSTLDNILCLSKRNISTALFNRNYEGYGKTTAYDLADDIKKYVIVHSFNENGFKLSNGGFAFGPLILFPNVYLRWKIKGIQDITAESLKVFNVIVPKLDLLIIGIGSRRQHSIKQIQELKVEIKKSGLNVEILSTPSAIATYNFMLADFRVVAGAFLPSLPQNEEYTQIGATFQNRIPLPSEKFSKKDE